MNLRCLLLLVPLISFLPCCATEPESDELPFDPAAIDLDNKADGEANLNLFIELIDWLRRQPRELLYTGPWTNWSENVKPLGLAKLAVMRWILDKHNLHDAYPPGARSGYLSSSFECTASARTARTVDGTCNDLDDPGMGSAGVRLGRNVPLAEIYPETAASMLEPNPREVSRRLLTRREFVPVDFLNLLAAAWVQFMIHDWFSHGDNRTDDFVRVPLSADDPLRARHGATELRVPKTALDASRRASDAGLPETYQNEVTHWWDGSQIYGSDRATSDRLRSFVGGELRVEAGGHLPLAPDGFEDTGFRRNWWLGLSLMHHLFTLEHNAIARMLAAAHPTWDDQRLFDTARLVNAAVMAKIHTVEWTPAILPNSTLKSAMRANWYGLFYWLESLGISFDEPILFGIVGNSKNLHGVPFTMTEEFVAVYRMHPLLPDELVFRRASGGGLIERVPTETTRDRGAAAITGRVALADLFYSFGTMHPGALTLHNYPPFLQDLAMPGLGPFDMGTVDVVRDRERGVPRYNQFRRLVQLKPIESFADLTDDPAVVAELEEVYGGDVEKLDLMIGCLAEGHRPKHFGFGETAFQIFILIASRRLQGDRFYTESYNADVYSQEGIDWVENASMKTVLLRHFPELSETGLADRDNAFEPW